MPIFIFTVFLSLVGCSSINQDSISGAVLKKITIQSNLIEDNRVVSFTEKNEIKEILEIIKVDDWVEIKDQNLNIILHIIIIQEYENLPSTTITLSKGSKNISHEVLRGEKMWFSVKDNLQRKIYENLLDKISRKAIKRS